VCKEIELKTVECVVCDGTGKESLSRHECNAYSHSALHAGSHYQYAPCSLCRGSGVSLVCGECGVVNGVEDLSPTFCTKCGHDIWHDDLEKVYVEGCD